MNWKEYIETQLNLNNVSKYRCNSPATQEVLIALKERFELSHLPDKLEELYRQTDGIDELLYFEEKGELTKTGELIWQIEKVIETNNTCRTAPYFKDIYKPLDQLLFISDAGNGDMFGYKTINGKFDGSDIYVWDHEDDSRNWVAPNLTKFIEGWTNGRITI